MTQIIIGRRDFLKKASAFTAFTALGGLAAQAALAAPPRAGANAPAAGQVGRFASIDQLLRQAVEQQRIAAVVAVGANQDGIVYQGAFGKENQSQGRDISLDTVFWLASMTKAITATACMQLIEQGKLQLEQPASQILPELASPQVLEGFDAKGQPRLRPAKRPITVRHLLTHTSGYTYSIWDEQLGRYEKAVGQADILDYKNAGFKSPLAFDPGERWEYGIGMDWIGKIVEAIADQSLEIYFRENIFVPLGMPNSGFLIGSEQKKRVATHYQRQSDGSLLVGPFEVPQRPEFFSGGAGLFSTPRDYMVFLQMLLHEGSFRGARILKPETVAAMRVNHIGDLSVQKLTTVNPALSVDVVELPAGTHKWGLSFDINTVAVPGGRAAGSIAWAGVHNTYFWVDPRKRVIGTFFTQLLPFFDATTIELYAGFEQGLYRGLAA